MPHRRRWAGRELFGRVVVLSSMPAGTTSPPPAVPHPSRGQSDHCVALIAGGRRRLHPIAFEYGVHERPHRLRRQCALLEPHGADRAAAPVPFGATGRGRVATHPDGGRRRPNSFIISVPCSGRRRGGSPPQHQRGGSPPSSCPCARPLAHGSRKGIGVDPTPARGTHCFQLRRAFSSAQQQQQRRGAGDASNTSGNAIRKVP